MNITKANGELVPFDEDKIRISLLRVKASAADIEKVISTVKSKIYEGISTSKLYRIVFHELKRLKRGVAGKYNLKRAIMRLGPTGFPFEQFVAALWDAEGSSVKTNVVVKGACVSHEVDVVADRGDTREFIECKHHSLNGNVCALKIPLYFYARFLDIEKQELRQAPRTGQIYMGSLVTNMRFTSEALTYGTCVGLNLVSWDFPPKSGLRERIDKAKLHPVTCLTTVSGNQQQKLMGREITLCRDLCERPEVLDLIGIRGAAAKRVLEESSAVCGDS